MTDSTPLFLRAARGEDTERAPVWFMRQAGRHLPEYRALKERYSFWDLVATPELALEVTMQPLRRYGMDAAILFSDIMTPLPAMGINVEFRPGPVIDDPIRSVEDVQRLHVPEIGEIAPYVAGAIRLIRQESPVPLIGFCGAPFTLAAYAVQGGGSKDFAEFRGLLRGNPKAAHALLDKLTELSLRYLTMQVEAGAQAVQVFDSWAGLHDRWTWQEYGAPYVRRLLDGLADLGVPRIYFALDVAHLIGDIGSLPAEVFGWDWRLPLDEVREALGARAVQGNLDPSVLLANHDVIRNEVRRVLRTGLGGGHVFNLGHGIFKTISPAAVEVAVDEIRAFDRHAERDKG